MRNYRTEPVVWGGDKKCEHQWGSTVLPAVNKAGNYTPTGIEQTNRANENGAISQDRNVEHGGQFCSLCGAWKGELGAEPTVQLYVQHLLEIFAEVKRVMKSTATFWLNIGDTYAATRWSGNGKDNPINKFKDGYRDINPTKGSDTPIPGKSKLAVPERLVMGLMDLGFIYRNDIIWHKPSCLPSSATDRFTVDFEHLYFFVKEEKYYFKQQFEKAKDWGPRDRTNGKYVGISHGAEGLTGTNSEFRNKRSVWHINPARSPEAHFATFPEKLIETPILAGCPEKGIVLDVFSGTATTGAVALRLGRDYIGIELNPEYFEMGRKRLEKITNQERLF